MKTVSRMKSFDSFTVSQLHQAMAQGEISATEIATSTLDAIEQANPVINAYTHITRERMLREAAKVDKPAQAVPHFRLWQASLMR